MMMTRLIYLVLVSVMVTLLFGCEKKEAPSEPPKEEQAKEEKAKEEAPKPEKAEVATKTAEGGELIQLKGPVLGSVSSERPAAKAWDDPKADYSTLESVQKDGEKATGKTVLFTGYVNSVMSPALFYSCQNEGDKIPVCATYGDALRDTVRALAPYCGCKEQKARILVKVTNDQAVLDAYPFYKGKCIAGEVVAIYDVQPDPAPTTLPEGVDYLSFDDVLFDGEAAAGKVVDLGLHKTLEPTVVDGVNLYSLSSEGCGEHNGVNGTFLVLETEKTKEILSKLPADGGETCQRMLLKITEGPERDYSNTYKAEIVGYGDTFEDIYPSPCP